MTENMSEPTYGVEVPSGNDTKYYLGNDETLWDWANAPIGVPFINSLAEVPLPDGYVLREDDEGVEFLVKGGPKSGVTTILASAENSFEDKTYVLALSMDYVSRNQFNAAGLSDERILRMNEF